MKWWQCSWCKWFFNNNEPRVVASHLPPEVKLEGHGCCPTCRTHEFDKVFQEQMAVSQQMFANSLIEE